MEGPNKQLIETWDAAWAKKDAQAMKDVFASDVVLHAGKTETQTQNSYLLSLLHVTRLKNCYKGLGVRLN